MFQLNGVSSAAGQSGSSGLVGTTSSVSSAIGSPARNTSAHSTSGVGSSATSRTSSNVGDVRRSRSQGTPDHHRHRLTKCLSTLSYPEPIPARHTNLVRSRQYASFGSTVTSKTILLYLFNVTFIRRVKI